MTLSIVTERLLLAREGQAKQIELKKYLTLMQAKNRSVYGSSIAELKALDPILAKVVADTMASITDGADDHPGLQSKITFMHKSVASFNRIVVAMVGVKNLYNGTETACAKAAGKAAGAAPAAPSET